MAHTDTQISLKLLIDTKSNKVIFGEAGKDFVDFMLSLLTLPLSSVISFLSPKNMVGATGQLYQSIGSLNDTYFLTNKKIPLLHPQVPIFDAACPLRLKNGNENVSNHYGYNGGDTSKGFVQGVITYMIKDDLEVTPMSAISSISLINRFNLKNAQLEERVVAVGKKEGLALLKASLESATVLTDVFCLSAGKTK